MPMLPCLLLPADRVHDPVSDPVEEGEELVTDADEERHFSGFCENIRYPCKVFTLRPHAFEGFWTLVDDETERTFPGHAFGFEVSSDDNASVILDGFGEVDGREGQERFPCDLGSRSE